MSSVLVVGGAGYIGSHTVYELVKIGEDVVVIDNLSTGFKQAVHEKARFYFGDIKNLDFLNSVLEKEDISCVIHFAALSQVGQSFSSPLKYYENNIYGTKVLLEAMVKNKIYNIIFSSSASIYGEPQNVPILETDIKNPTNPYGETKLAVENMLKWVDAAHNIKYVALRYFNACGADISGDIGESHNPETHIIPIVLKTSLKILPKVDIFGNNYPTKDGTAIRDYVHVSDLAHAHILAMRYLEDGNKSDCFNLGSETGFSVKEIIDAAKNISKRDISVNIAKKRPGDPSILIACNKKAKKILKWQPQYNDIDYILKTAYNWHKTHPYGFSSTD